MSTFYEKLKQLCRDIGAKVSPFVIRGLGMNKGAATAWKAGRKPTAANIKKILDFFEISEDYLTNNCLPVEAGLGSKAIDKWVLLNEKLQPVVDVYGNDIDDSIITRICAICESKHITPTQLYTNYNVTPELVRTALRGKKGQNQNSIDRLAKYLCVQPKYISGSEPLPIKISVEKARAFFLSFEREVDRIRKGTMPFVQSAGRGVLELRKICMEICNKIDDEIKHGTTSEILKTAVAIGKEIRPMAEKILPLLHDIATDSESTPKTITLEDAGDMINVYNSGKKEFSVRKDAPYAELTDKITELERKNKDLIDTVKNQSESIKNLSNRDDGGAVPDSLNDADTDQQSASAS